MASRNYTVEDGGTIYVGLACEISSDDATLFHKLGLGGSEIREILYRFVDAKWAKTLVAKAIKARTENGEILAALAEKARIDRQEAALAEKIAKLPKVDPEAEARIFGT